MGYTYNHNREQRRWPKNLTDPEKQIINKFNTTEDQACENALRELAEQGCNIIFATSFDLKITSSKSQRIILISSSATHRLQGSQQRVENVHNYFGKSIRHVISPVSRRSEDQNELTWLCRCEAFAEVISIHAFYLGQERDDDAKWS